MAYDLKSRLLRKIRLNSVSILRYDHIYRLNSYLSLEVKNVPLLMTMDGTVCFNFPDFHILKSIIRVRPLCDKSFQRAELTSLSSVHVHGVAYRLCYVRVHNSVILEVECHTFMSS